MVSALDRLSRRQEIRLQRLRLAMAAPQHRIEVERAEIERRDVAAVRCGAARVFAGQSGVETLGVRVAEQEKDVGSHDATVERGALFRKPARSMAAMQICMKKHLPRGQLERWDDVRIFLAAVRAGSFTAAARALGTDQSTISRRLAALEREIGAALFERTRRGPVPTEIALRLREDAERVEADMFRMADTVFGGEPKPRGRVRIATIEAIAIHFVAPRVLPRLAKENPEIEVELVSGFRAVDLANHEADIALRFFRPVSGDLVGRRLARLPVVVLAKKALARKLRGKPPSELPWVAVELPEIETPEDAWLRAHAGQARALRCNNYEVQLAAIRAGVGVGLVPRAALQAHPDLTSLEAMPPGPTLELFLITRRAIRTVPRIARVVELLVSELGQLDSR
jgi:DNA-binding transcriptional LysR family regulator